jgi:flagellar assembly protein FliH
MSGNAFMPKRTFEPEPGVMDLLKDWPSPEGQAQSEDGADDHESQLAHQAAQPVKQVRTNAFFKPKLMPGQRQPVKADNPELKPLTADDLEQIRQAAYEEGLTEGKEEGFSQGYQEGREQGLQDGTAQGLAEGKKQGLAEGEGLIREQLQALQILLDQLQQPLQKVDQQVEQALLELALAMAQAVIGVEVTTNPQLILQSMREAVDALPYQAQNLIIKLHPADLAVIEQHYSSEALNERQWQLRAEPAMSRGDCRVETKESSVDRSLKTRLQASLEHFLQEPVISASHSESAS